MNWRTLAVWLFRLLPFGLEIIKLFRKDKPMSEAVVKYGTKETEKLIKTLGSLVATGWKAGKDGIQLSDITILPSVLIDIISIVNNLPEVSDEVKDLDLTELKTVIVKVVEEVQRVIAEVK